ncbi:hypothetical protein [Arcticibacter sp.]|uniref:hypothetical protein n=1 Tax=Arcticibacter sp. TaxID=1872630 RepID=UPI00388D416B
MMITNPNDPAQPVIVGTSADVIPQVGSSTWQMPGLSKREAMAMAAMQGMYHNGVMTEHGQVSRDPQTIATYAVMAADALIEALNKGGE